MKNIQKFPCFLPSLLAGLSLFVGFTPHVHAAEAGTVYTQVSTNGVGLGYATSVADDVALRGQYSYFSPSSYSGNVGDYGSSSTATANTQWSSASFLADWYPFTTGFRLSGGLVFTNEVVTVNATNATIGGLTGASGQTATGRINLSPNPAPYIGLGYMTRPKDAKGFGFNFDLGVIKLSPDVTLTSTGAIPATQAQINAQIANVQDAVKQLQYFPVLGLGLSYSF